jgi:hypothetical protein
MPFTPFHIVAGTSIKSVIPKYFSFSTFALTNVLIDCEVLYYYFTTGILEHKFFHTILGVSIVAVICATLGKPLCEFGLRIWNRAFNTKNFKWFKTGIKINNFSSWLGAIIGALSQLIFDSIMHRDMTPLFPFSSQNIFLKIVSVEILHFICLGLFIVGVFIYLLKKIFFK